MSLNSMEFIIHKVNKISKVFSLSLSLSLLLVSLSVNVAWGEDYYYTKDLNPQGQSLTFNASVLFRFTGDIFTNAGEITFNRIVEEPGSNYVTFGYSDSRKKITNSGTMAFNVLFGGMSIYSSDFINERSGKVITTSDKGMGTVTFQSHIINHGTMNINTAALFVGGIENRGKMTINTINQGYPAWTVESGALDNYGEIKIVGLDNPNNNDTGPYVQFAEIINQGPMFDSELGHRVEGKLTHTRGLLIARKGFLNSGIINTYDESTQETFESIFRGDMRNQGTVNALRTTFDGVFINVADGLFRVSNVNILPHKDGEYTTFKKKFNNAGYFNSRGNVKFEDDVVNSGGQFYIHSGSALFAGNFTNKTEHTKGGYAEFRVNTIIPGNVINGILKEINLVGATLKVGGTFYNKGTLIFSVLNGVMGYLNGTLVNEPEDLLTTNTAGRIQVNVSEMVIGKEYEIIKNFIDEDFLTDMPLSFVGQHSQGKYVGRYSYSPDGSLKVWLENSSGGENPEQPDPIDPTDPTTPSMAEKTNNDSIRDAIVKNMLEADPDFFNKPYAEFLGQAITDTDKTLQTSVIAQPKNMLNAFKADTLTSPLHSAYVSRLTASSETIMNDSSNFINPLERASQTQFFATPFGGVFKGDALNGHLFGLSVGLTYVDDEYIAQGHFAYAKGQSTQDLATQSTELNGDLFQVGGFARLFYGKVETDINANFIFGKFSLDNVWLNADMMNSNSNFNNYQVNLGGVVGWRFGEDLSVKPFVGVQGYYENQGEFQQDSGLALTSEAYNSMIIDALAGLEGRYIFDNGSFIFAKASYESKLYNSHKEVFMRTADESLKYENETYDSLISANLGARLLSTQHFKLDIEALYKYYGNELSYFGGNLGVKFSF